MPTRILCLVGTRPEGIKMAPVIAALRAEPWVELRVATSAQHRELLDEVLRLFEIEPDLDLDLMRPGQSLAGLSAGLAERLDRLLAEQAPDLVIAQGDTTTVFMAALTSFYRRIPFAHVEAGLRTHDRDSPFPEEMNRVFAGYLADLHFAPTEGARDALLAERVPAARIHVTGNTVIDALLSQSGRSPPLDLPEAGDRRLMLVTAHRRENFGAPMAAAFGAIRALAETRSDLHVLYPVHPNPEVQAAAQRILAGHPRISLCAPLDYARLTSALKRAHLVLTDSGGLQEEAPALGRPVLVMRDSTERPEAMTAGVARLVGTDPVRIHEEVLRLLDDRDHYAAMAVGSSPYGDGRASERIISALRRHFGQPDPEPPPPFLPGA